MHGDALKMSIDGGEEADDLHVAALAKYVERPRAVFAGTPGKENFRFQGAPPGSVHRRLLDMSAPTKSVAAEHSSEVYTQRNAYCCDR
jgi:hypothetical protein